MATPMPAEPFLCPLLPRDYESTHEEVRYTQVERVLEDLSRLLAGRQLQAKAYFPPSFFSAYYERTIKRLAVQAPFEKIRLRCKSFLDSRGIVTITQPVDPEEIGRLSEFIPNESLPVGDSNDSGDENARLRTEIMQGIFIAKGRVTHCERMMATYPQYLKRHDELMNHIMKEPGALEISWRYYLAFMNEALMQLAEDSCRLFGGDKAWFHDPLSVPPKLRQLGDLNVKLAHRPWELEEADIHRVLGSWRLIDLCQAVIILIQFHAMCSFAAGLGVLPECDLGRVCTKDRKMSISVAAEGLRSNNVGIIRTLLNFQEAVETAETEDMEDNSESDREDEFESFAGGALRYVTYTSHCSRRFYASDFNWRNQGYETVERILPNTAQFLNDTLDFTYNMTDNSLCTIPKVETKPLRRAIWKYTQKVYGIDYDDYNYTEVNVLLSKATKTYLKKAACTPHLLTCEDFSQVDLGVTSSEMVHTMLLVMEARKEAELLYWLHILTALL